jgi:pyridinium-3,5-biscarboxylic acid mononucleotide sulfurtransferase
MLSAGTTGAGGPVVQLREWETESGRDVENTVVGHTQKYIVAHVPPYRLGFLSITLLRMADLEILRSHLATLGRVVLGYSGGVDSGLLAVAARQALGPDRFLAVTGRSASYPAVQADTAVELARRFDIPVLEVETHELEDPRYLSNSTERCYFCKSELWTRLHEIARERGFDTIIDGTNADDVGEHRPGLRAAAEQRVRSPLAELGWTKQDVRHAARGLGLPTWSAPAAPCLSSRVLYGLEITPERLRQVEQGEAYLRGLGIEGDLRVRHHGSKARIEVAPDQMDRLKPYWQAVASVFSGIGFTTVELDPQGYRRGGLLAIAPRASR